jgi:hypothetical protein
MTDRLGIRALTMQQPYATAMARGVGLYSRRGKAVKFQPEGEWLAIHCGQNSEHLNNKATMDAVRKLWPDCPSDSELKAQQRSIVGIAHFVEGDCNASAVAAADPLLRMYDCSKPVAWRADSALPWPGGSTPYPKGNLQIWHVARSGFSEKGAGAELLARAEAGAAMGGADVKPSLQVGSAGQGAAGGPAGSNEVPLLPSTRPSSARLRLLGARLVALRRSQKDRQAGRHGTGAPRPTLRGGPGLVLGAGPSAWGARALAASTVKLLPTAAIPQPLAHPGGRPRAKVEPAEVKAEGGQPDAEEPPKKRKRK